MDRNEVRNWLLSGWFLGVELPASTEARRRWLGIHPFRPTESFHFERDVRKIPLRFCVRVLEVDRSFDFHTYDLHPEYIHAIETVYFDAVEDALEKVDALGIDLGLLVDGRRCDYPL